MSYATRKDFFTPQGLPASVCVPARRTIDVVHVADSVFEVAGHGLSADDQVRFTTTGEGAVLVGGLSATTLYEAEPVGLDLFRVRLAGAPVAVTNQGTGVQQIVVDFGPKIDDALEARSSYVDIHAKAYRPPFKAPYPPWLVLAVCKLAALDVALHLRSSSPGYSVENLQKEAEKIEAFLARLMRGEPLAKPPVDQTPESPEQGAEAYDVEDRGWSKGPLV